MIREERVVPVLGGLRGNALKSPYGFGLEWLLVGELKPEWAVGSR
jgi:hypothetical protein